ncbi:MAG: COR domain-containing protein [Verrucomicrobiota bacterium]
MKDAIAKVAAGLPEMGRSFPEAWDKARKALKECQKAYLPIEKYFEICADHGVEDKEDAQLLLRICHAIGDLIHFQHDTFLRDIVVLKPDLLATAISFVLDDERTRKEKGLVDFSRLGELWTDPARDIEDRYDANLHPLFLRLMERFDLSYRIAQLVPDKRPDPIPVWSEGPGAGDVEQVQICRIVDRAKNQPAKAEGLFYQLIVRLHKFSLGREDNEESVHWQQGLVIEDNTGARAFLEHKGYDVRITVRSPHPQRFLSTLNHCSSALLGMGTAIAASIEVACGEFLGGTAL